jgi:imidazolonepropionase-like amidohydrolase
MNSDGKTSEILFSNAWLIDGTGSSPLEKAWIHVVGKRIENVGQGTPPVLSGVDVLDLAGGTLMPGLMDAHTHPGNLDVDITTVPTYPPAVFVHKVSQILEKDLRLGFTTLRDAGGLDAGFRAAVEQNLINGPRLFLSIAPLTQTGGHADKRKIGEFAPIPRNSLGIFPAICDDEGQIRRAVREMLRQGANQIKVMADGGVLSPTGGPGIPQFTVPELRVAVETAEAAGSYVLAHVYSSRAVRNCLEAGVRSLEHATLMDRDTAKRIADHGAFLVPTLSIFDLLYERADEIGLRPSWREKLLRVREGAQASLAAAHEAGVRIASGSDIVGPFQEYKGRELALKAKVLGAMNAIVSATRVTAELLRIDDVLGAVTPGKLADLIVVDGNPLDDLSVFEPDSGKILLVMKDGRIVHQSSRFLAADNS